MKPKVAVAMSGGVDSSVVAGLLQQQGYDILGITMNQLDMRLLHTDAAHNDPEQAGRDAAEVCKHLGIAHHIVDLRQEFQQHVVENFVAEYLSGRTPNPCVRCNATIKWGALWQAAQRLDVDYMATGHYCRVQFDSQSGRYLLKKATHKAKDQSYALWRLSQEQRSHTLFPLGELNKEEVRALAEKMGLAVAQKSESQEICFILDDDFRRFITDRLRKLGIEIPPGEFVDQDGKVIGRHRGYPFYTIGQRKGLGIALGRPVFVTDIDVKNNRIRIGDKQDLMASKLVADQTNWIAWSQPPVGSSVEARIRYKDPGFPAVIERVDRNRVWIRFHEPRPAVTPGQSAVFYQGEVLVGGGIIESAVK
jgi:tRNA-uridine 2-sulfurtransferase